MHTSHPKWTSNVLWLAAAYNVAWGLWVVLFPQSFFQWVGIEPINYAAVWQCVGMIVGVYGIGFAIAARNPFRHWPIVLVGLLGKIFGPLGFFIGWLSGSVPLEFGWMLITNDLIWWVPFVAILYESMRWHNDPSKGVFISQHEETVRSVKSQRCETLEKLSFKRPTLVVFLRHAGCTFCRQTLTDLRTIRDDLDELGFSVAIVHMGSPMDGTLMLAKYDLDYFHHFSDRQCRLYRAFGLERGTFGQVFSWRVLTRGFAAALGRGHGLGAIQGDGFQLPGVFVMHDGKVLLARPAADASERFDYLALARKASDLLRSNNCSTHTTVSAELEVDGSRQVL